MRFLRRTALAGVVWATAAMTLVAGTPHFACRCGDGSVKLFCRGFVTPAGGCCCAGRSAVATCCGKTPSTRTPSCPKCCTHHAGYARHRTSGNVLEIHGTGCTRTMVQAEVLSVSGERTIVGEGFSSSLAFAPGVLPNPVLLHAERDRSAWQFDRLPPPTDRVITLQRLTL